jgi:hypothetical protein
VTELSDLDRQVLDFEARRWNFAGAKATAALETFGLSEPRYYQLVNAIIDKPEALVYAPSTVKRLRRLRETRARKRARG